MGDQTLPPHDDPVQEPTGSPLETKEPASQGEDAVITDFEGVIKDFKLRQSKPSHKEAVAEMVARKLLDVFAVTTIGILLAGVVLILMIMQHYYSPQDAETLVEKAIVPFLRGAASFATTVFGPLLAFILGFYFGKGSDS